MAVDLGLCCSDFNVSSSLEFPTLRNSLIFELKFALVLDVSGFCTFLEFNEV
jgi:hypothetical protein